MAFKPVYSFNTFYVLHSSLDIARDLVPLSMQFFVFSFICDQSFSICDMTLTRISQQSVLIFHWPVCFIFFGFKGKLPPTKNHGEETTVSVDGIFSEKKHHCP